MVERVSSKHLLNRYQLDAEIGRGGMGVVYRARDPVLDRVVAVKMISARDTDELEEERFRREAQLVARLDHPGIVPIYDFGRHGDDLFFIMPLLEGTTLHSLLAQGTLRFGDVLEIVAQVAEVLDYSAAQGVVHRDIKPENVMVEDLDEGKPRARVMDFGLAITNQRTRITKTGHLPGTLAYLAPEHILSLDVDGRADLYSLGTIFYECLAGEPPFSGGSQGAVLYRIVHEAPRSLSSWGYDPELDELVLRCLEKEPGSRPQRGQEIAVALRAYLSTIADTEEALLPMPLVGGLPPMPARPSSPLFGREAELAELERCLTAATLGECHFVLLGGEAGLGKTRLLHELEPLARAKGAQVLSGRFSGHETFPYHGFCELIQDYFRSRDSTSMGTDPPDLDDLAPELVGLFPALGEIPELRHSRGHHLPDPLSLQGPSTGALPGDSTRIFELLARTFARLARGRLLVLLLENLHTAGTSLNALEYLVRRLGPTPTLVVGTWRREEAPRGHPLHNLLRAFAGDQRFCALELQPLPLEEHRRLLTSLLSTESRQPLLVGSELAQKLHAATEGNPFFTHELVRALLEAGDLTADETGTWALSGAAALGFGSLPETIQQVVETRLERLPEDVRRVLTVASVLGKSFEFRDLQALLNDADLAEEALEHLLREGLLEEDRRSRGAVLHFRSGVVCDVLHGELSRRRRRSLHRRYAVHLEGRYGAQLERVYPQLVYHFSEGDEAVKTVTYALMLARRAAGAFSPTDTIRAARTALEFMEDYELEGGEVEGELRQLLAAALRLQGQLLPALREAAKACQRLEAAGEEGAAAGPALLAAEIAWQLRRMDETRRFLARGIELARNAGAEERLRKLLVLAATVANLRGEHGKAKHFLHEAEHLEARDERVTPTPGGILRTALPSPPTTLDPVQIFSVEDAEVLVNVFEPLLDADAEGHLVQRLATGWHTDDGGGTFHLALRHDVHFSDGTLMSALEVRRAFIEAIRRRVGTLPAAFAELIGAEELRRGATEFPGLEVVAEEALRFHLSRSLPIFPALLTDPRTGVARRTTEGALVGTGPFRLASGEQIASGGDLRLIRNPHAWRGPPPLEGIDLRVMADAATLAAELRGGRLDLGRDLPPSELDELLRDPRLRAGLVEAPRTNVYFAMFNAREGPLARDPRIRRVLRASVRSQDIVWRTLGRYAQPAGGVIPPGILGHQPGRRQTFLDREDALELLASTGYAKPIELEARVHPMLWDQYSALLEALLETWRSVGVQVRVERAPMEVLLETLRDPAGIDVVFGRWMPDYYDPDNATRSLFHSKIGLYRRFFTSTTLDTLLDQARHEPESTARLDLYRKVEELLSMEDAVLPLFHDVNYRIAMPRLRGLRHLNVAPYVNYNELWLSNEEEKQTLPPPSFGDEAPLRVPVLARFDSLEPVLALFVEPAQVLPNVFETLTTIEEGAQVAPHLAEKIVLEDGARRARIRLRDGVRFHDGRPLSTKDVRYSFERLLRMPYPGVESALLPIRGARELHTGQADHLAGFEAISDRELMVELAHPVPFFPAMLTNPMTAIVAEGSDRFDDSWLEGSVGTGPYRLRRLVPGKLIELEAHGAYWRSGLPRHPRLDFELGVPSERLAEDFRQGRFALAVGLRPVEVEALRQEPRFTSGFREAPAFCTYFLAFNIRQGPFVDVGKRRRFRRALKVESLVRSTLGRLGLPARGLISPGLLGHEPLELHQRGAASNQFTADFSGESLRVSVHPAYFEQYPYVWEALRHTLEQGGMTFQVNQSSMADILDEVDCGRVDLVVARRLAAYPDPDAFVNIFHSVDGLFGNLVGSKEMDRLIEKGRSETDPTLRHVIYRELERLLLDEALIVPLFDEQIYCLAQPEVHGLRLRLAWPRIAYEELVVAE